MEQEEYLKESGFLNALKIIGKIILFLLFVALFFVIGLFIGYSVIGDGNFWEVLNQDTWRHIFEFIEI
ncbi:DNA-directed RNA polymerase subunit beta [Fundicoccus culcitae]|uniref:DNA-directed RNA polymerase subunit beta n=1 Tax=Fundicoccus culcitae TaxID=2969821 RepID=A0ABY5P5G7_9LACT|nr:DNA-directed RNA polymerase subunit beta [Fundicoccus culcitae]UUX33997.1 DNA-directed RNA polymerase subunit beta [Fundicoccus culcitae]